MGVGAASGNGDLQPLTQQSPAPLAGVAHKQKVRATAGGRVSSNPDGIPETQRGFTLKQKRSETFRF